MTKQLQLKIIATCIAFGLLGLLIVTPMTRPTRVFPEDLLSSWGYKTSSVDKWGHHIRSAKNYGSSEEAFYARFDLAVARYRSPAEATSEKVRIERERESMPGKEKDYRHFLLRGEMFYTISPTSNYSRLDHLPQLLTRIDEHLSAQKQ